MIFSKDEARVQFVLNRAKEQNKVLFDYLHEKKDHIEETFGEPLDWRRLEDKNVSMVVFSKPFNGYDRETWPEMIAWLVEKIRKLKAVFAPEIPNLRQLLRTRFPREGSA